MKVRLVGAELFHADRETDGRTEMTKLIVAFRNFAKRQKLHFGLSFRCITRAGRTTQY
jgi:hypothetical protein